MPAYLLIIRSRLPTRLPSSLAGQTRQHWRRLLTRPSPPTFVTHVSGRRADHPKVSLQSFSAGEKRSRSKMSWSQPTRRARFPANSSASNTPTISARRLFKRSALAINSPEQAGATGNHIPADQSGSPSQQFFNRDRQIANPLPGRVIDSIRDRWRYRNCGQLSEAL